MIERITAPSVVGWSWLIPPYNWTFGAVAAQPTERVEPSTPARSSTNSKGPCRPGLRPCCAHRRVPCPYRRARRPWRATPSGPLLGVWFRRGGCAMSDLNEERILRDVQCDAADLRRSTRYSEVVNRYLGARSYTGPGPVAAPVPQPATGAVVVAVDDSSVSFVAVDHAAIEAELHGWNLRLLHVRQTATARCEPDPGRTPAATDRPGACTLAYRTGHQQPGRRLTGGDAARRGEGRRPTRDGFPARYGGFRPRPDGGGSSRSTPWAA